MADPRLQKLANILVHYSLEIQLGDKFAISTPHAAKPLLREIYREAVRAGAQVRVNYRDEELAKIYYDAASDEQLTTISELAKFEMNYFNKSLYIMGGENTKFLSGVDSRRIQMQQQAIKPLSDLQMQLSASGALRWCVTLFPTNALAQDANMSLEAYEEFVYGAGLLNDPDPVASWQKVRDTQEHIRTYLEQRNEIHIVAPDTDITYCVGGRTWRSSYGLRNFPDGEVFTGPIEESVNGTVRFSYPAVYHGNEVEDVRLTFQNGKVIEATASRGQDFLIAMLDTDEGSRYLGEVAFGLNYGIQTYSKNILFDEKIGGTMHMALGASYPETGGKNQSGIHWDIVSDMHQGKVYADGELCYENGKFVI
jgi:aminopeptidase